MEFCESRIVQTLVWCEQDLEDLVAAYEEQEEEQAGELQQLHYKLNTSLMSAGVDTSDIDLDGVASAHMKVTPATLSEQKRVVSLGSC